MACSKSACACGFDVFTGWRTLPKFLAVHAAKLAGAGSDALSCCCAPAGNELTARKKAKSTNKRQTATVLSLLAHTKSPRQFEIELFVPRANHPGKILLRTGYSTEIVAAINTG